jgi:hypothetical protein
MTDMVQPYWQAKAKALHSAMLEQPSTYLGSPPFKETMVVSSGISEIEIQAISDMFDDDLLDMITLTEPNLGEPMSGFFFNKLVHLLSLNTVRHLWELSVLIEHSTHIDECNHFLEWGGGFGNLTRIMAVHPGFTTYTIVDLPEMALIQKETLERMGVRKVFLNKKPEKNVKGIYLVDINHLKLLDDHEADCFISCWALSESTNSAIEYVLNKKAFNASSALIIRQEDSDLFDSASQVDKLYDDWTYISKLEHLPGNVALVR